MRADIFAGGTLCGVAIAAVGIGMASRPAIGLIAGGVGLIAWFCLTLKVMGRHVDR